MTCALLILPVISALSLKAQDFQITFTGSGGSTTVDSVIVENLTQGTILKMKGSEVLYLKGVVPVFETISDNETGRISFYPNPMKDYGRMQFVLPGQGETIIEMHDIAGGKLKETGTSHWENPNTGATNETGFTALPGGGRNDDGGFFDAIGYLGIFWSSSDFYPYTRAHILDILYNSSNAGMNAGIDETSKIRGFSVRCIKDK